MLRIRPLAALLMLAGALAACSSSAGSSPSATTTKPNTVTISNFKFVPATLTVKVGTKVTFTNEDNEPHTATSQSTSTIHSPTLSKGQSYTITFTKPGTYDYICTIHPFMKGTVIVR